MTRYEIDWDYEDHHATPLPPKPDGWEFAYVEFDSGLLTVGIANGTDTARFWLEGDEHHDNLDYPGEVELAETDDEDKLRAYGEQLCERFDAGAYDAAILILEKIREDLADAILNRGTWDIGDPEPVGVTHVHDDSDDAGDGNSSHWGRTTHGDWKGYKTGYKTYLDWPALVRRWGPVHKRKEC